LGPEWEVKLEDGKILHQGRGREWCTHPDSCRHRSQGNQNQSLRRSTGWQCLEG
jgi:hypothetical protein